MSISMIILTFLALGSALWVTHWVMKDYDEWRGPREPTVWIKRLITLGGYRVDLHKIVAADDDYCYHTHPANAIRIILWGGYVEEVPGFREDGSVGGLTLYFRWWPGRIGRVPPRMCHRIHSLLRGPSYSLWLRCPKVADIRLVGAGWAIWCPYCDILVAPVDYRKVDGITYCAHCDGNIEHELAKGVYGG